MLKWKLTNTWNNINFCYPFLKNWMKIMLKSNSFARERKGLHVFSVAVCCLLLLLTSCNESVSQLATFRLFVGVLMDVKKVWGTFSALLEGVGGRSSHLSPTLRKLEWDLSFKIIPAICAYLNYWKKNYN